MPWACPSQVRKIGCVVAAILVGAVEMLVIVCCACAVSVYLVHLRLVSNCGRVIAISCISIESNLNLLIAICDSAFCRHLIVY